ncbi:MAG: DUF427 domain-containing protein [Planctomycetota bacterium]
MRHRVKENVWDYPRPPRLERFAGSVRIEHAGIELVQATEAYRVLETSHPPTYYLPLASLTGAARAALRPSRRQVTACEWKGLASYLDLQLPGQRPLQAVAWTYEAPRRTFAALRGHLAFYAAQLDLCEVDGERVVRQAGDFYGGWITSWIQGGERGFKGAPGTWGW